MQVQKDRGDYLVYQTIRHIMAARAIHNIFKTNESHLVITHRTLKICSALTKAANIALTVLLEQKEEDNANVEDNQQSDTVKEISQDSESVVIPENKGTK
ncbi:hypothetical protein CEXT_166811 [Caerostris extrusa]|uniref:Uncharacterized protein n=1 Tax=Caerostris extrusa TaxID=172846 RepID=A0AAV4RNY6_CAEEX|nr:hypothetical protein CEXT_166811 [Caerostris extrusa]